MPQPTRLFGRVMQSDGGRGCCNRLASSLVRLSGLIHPGCERRYPMSHSWDGRSGKCQPSSLTGSSGRWHDGHVGLPPGVGGAPLSPGGAAAAPPPPPPPPKGSPPPP